MEYYNGILCISGSELIRSESNPTGVMSLSYYTNLVSQKTINRIRRATKDTPALIEYNSLPIRYRQMWEALNGDPNKQADNNSVLSKIVLDEEARQFYLDHRLPNGEELKMEVQMQYTNEASILNTINAIINKRIAMRKSNTGGEVKRCQIWDKMAETIHREDIQKQYKHNLPKTGVTLRRKMKNYISNGYIGLVHSGYCNDNSRKVNVMIKRLLLSLYTMPNKPFCASVYEMYNLFVNGKIEVYDQKTGELFDRRTFTKNGKPIELSEPTIWAYINNPENRIVVDEMRNDISYNRRTHQPFHRRKSPVFAFSKISMDDRDLTRKLHSGGRVKAYYTYDVASGCVIGKAYSKTKDESLFIDCLRDTFRTMDVNGWGVPMEVEVEHHLVNKFFDDLAVMFPYLRICAAGNSREKRAEHGNRAKKYGAEKKMGIPTGRWWSRHEAYYMPLNKVNDQIVHPTGSYDQIVADDMAAITKYNNEPHPRQKTYPGMTRWDVLCMNVNPDLRPINKSMLYRYIGEMTPTSIRNSKELTVQYAQYQLPNVSAMSRLRSNDLNVQAYYLPNSEGQITEVHIYQGDKFIGTCERIDPYNEAKCERTQIDNDSIAKQSAYDAQYRTMVKKGKADLAKIGLMTTEQIAAIEQVKPQAIAVTAQTSADQYDIDTLIKNYNPEAIRLSAQENL